MGLAYCLDVEEVPITALLGAGLNGDRSIPRTLQDRSQCFLGLLDGRLGRGRLSRRRRAGRNPVAASKLAFLSIDGLRDIPNRSNLGNQDRIGEVDRGTRCLLRAEEALPFPSPV